MSSWLEQVRHGNLDAIPSSITFKDAWEMALLIDGFQVAGSRKMCFAISRRVAKDIRLMDKKRLSALDLWIALFAHQRLHCFIGLPLTTDEKLFIMKLGNVLGLALTDLTPKQRAGIMSMVLRKGPG